MPMRAPVRTHVGWGQMRALRPESKSCVPEMEKSSYQGMRQFNT